jgi:hypothetical protein
LNGPNLCCESAEPQQNPGFAGVLRFGENQGAVREGCVIRENRAPNPKISEKFQAKTPMDAGFCGGVDGVWKNRR